MITIDRRDFACTICMDVLHEPTSLSCGHSFCRDCLADLWASQPSRFLCPSCRQVIINVPATSITLQNIVSNFTNTATSPRSHRSENREEFESRFSSSVIAPTGPTGAAVAAAFANILGLEVSTDVEYWFLFGGTCLVFVLWLGSKLVSFFVQEDDPDRMLDANYTTLDGSISSQLESRSYLLFLIMTLLTCPRSLGVYTFLLQCNDIPLTCCLLAVVDLIEYNEFPFSNTVARIQSDMKLAAKRVLFSLILARTISYLPLSWLPDFIYYPIILFIILTKGGFWI